MARQKMILAWLTLPLFLTGCTPAKPVHLGSLNEPGTPSEWLAKLQARMTDGPQDVKNMQAIQGLTVSIDSNHGTFEVMNDSGFYIDQLTFGCDAGKKQFVFFVWDVGEYPSSKHPAPSADSQTHAPPGFVLDRQADDGLIIDWLEPRKSRRILSAATAKPDHLTLVHNDPKNDESLGASQLAWIIHNYQLHDCKVLDVADATEDDPRK